MPKAVSNSGTQPSFSRSGMSKTMIGVLSRGLYKPLAIPSSPSSPSASSLAIHPSSVLPIISNGRCPTPQTTAHGFAERVLRLVPVAPSEEYGTSLTPPILHVCPARCRERSQGTLRPPSDLARGLHIYLRNSSAKCSQNRTLRLTRH